MQKGRIRKDTCEVDDEGANDQWREVVAWDLGNEISYRLKLQGTYCYLYPSQKYISADTDNGGAQGRNALRHVGHD